MIDRSTRLIAISTLMLLVASVIILRNSVTQRWDPCADPDRLRSLPVFESALDRNVFIYEEPDQPLWIEGLLGSRSMFEEPMRFRFIRSYDLARFLQSGLLLLRNFPLPSDRDERRVIEIDGEPVPFRVRARGTGETPFITAYIFAIGNDPVGEPTLGSLRRVLDEPWSGPKLVTILLFEASTTRGDFESHEAALLDRLSTGWRQFRAACDPRFQP